MSFGLLEGLAVGQMGIGLAGILGGGDSRQDEIYNMLKKRAKGIDPRLLAEMRMRARGAIGNEATAVGSATTNRLLRMGAPVSKQQEVQADINQQRFGAIGGALTGVDALNENVKSSALGQMAGMPDDGDPFSELFGMGMGGLQTSLQNQRYMERLDALMAKYKTPGVSGGTV